MTRPSLTVRTGGDSWPAVVLLHGGPGAPGHMAPLRRNLADGFRVLEPFQRRRGDEPLTVATHVDDLLALLDERLPGERPALVGSSWGAMLGLAAAAWHPERFGALVLIGCGTFDAAARRSFQDEVSRRTPASLRARLEALSREVPDPDERLRRMGDLLTPLYTHDPLTDDLEWERCDAAGHAESWADMLRLQEAGELPAAAASFAGPVLMLHGARDPHPGPAIRASLVPHLPQLAYVEWARCGHYPWIERHVAERFHGLLREWLAEHTPPGPTQVIRRLPPR